MKENTYTQLVDAVREKDAFAMTILGAYFLDNGNTQEVVDCGCSYLKVAGETKNCIWAKNILFLLYRIEEFKQPFSRQVLVEADALQQLKIYADKGNRWAMTAYGNLVFTGLSNPQNKEEGATYLNMAADRSCLLAHELIEEYGIKRVIRPAFGEMYDALMNKDYSKFWLK